MFLIFTIIKVIIREVFLEIPGSDPLENIWFFWSYSSNTWVKVEVWGRVFLHCVTPHFTRPDMRPFFIFIPLLFVWIVRKFRQNRLLKQTLCCNNIICLHLLLPELI